MNYVWQAECEQLTSRCRVFVLLPGTDRMRVLRSAVQWVAAYELAQKKMKTAVSKWWSETSDGWLTFGFGGTGGDGGGGGELQSDPNLAPGPLRRAFNYIAYRDPDYQPVPGPDTRVHTKAFPAHMLAELAEAERRAEVGGGGGAAAAAPACQSIASWLPGFHAGACRGSGVVVRVSRCDDASRAACAGAAPGGLRRRHRRGRAGAELHHGGPRCAQGRCEHNSITA
jgi:hypothetical protein